MNELLDYPLPENIAPADEEAFREFVRQDPDNRSPVLGNARRATKEFLAWRASQPRFRDMPQSHWRVPLIKLNADPLNDPTSLIQIYNRVGGGYTIQYGPTKKYIPPGGNLLAYAIQYFPDAPIFKDLAL